MFLLFFLLLSFEPHRHTAKHDESKYKKKKQEVRLNAQNYRPSITAMKKKKVSKQKKKKLRVYISSQEWNEIEQIGSGVNFYEGKKTFFYNGQPLRDDAGQLVYDDVEKSTWQVIIILPGVIEITP
ncbi:predicted protein [Chaetoceros tenuissimus]|uniref:Uncharacterized protein n=1 Tax=Chaetoceros tenuissimus TaxID=426638 RepID=A0AAD3HB47_9STRA|nr:predicted protein [Chaetoceros tenuissimus]